MAFKFKHKPTDEAELDVTAFLNLMIVLVPVLLLTLSFTQITVLEIKLPELTGGFTSSKESQSSLEVVIKEQGIQVFYPTNTTMLQDIPATKDADGNLVYDFQKLSMLMRALKTELQDKRDVLVLASKDIAYQHLVSTMDAVKSYKTVVVASQVEVELFPEVSLGDAS
jgi:biopolymer transport protein ExbD